MGLTTIPVIIFLIFYGAIDPDGLIEKNAHKSYTDQRTSIYGN